ncbi:MAG: GIY-YIG nuclease family protein [Candidatus Berkelbacteria bacterium]
MNNWSVYILQCSDNTYYTGITTDIEKRLIAHQTGKGAKYTAGRLPVKIVYFKDNLTESQARKEEFRIKSLSRSDKIKLIFDK